MTVRESILLLLLTISSVLVAQNDTIVVKDYANIFVTIDESGEINPVTDYQSIEKAGFFLNEVPQGQLRICNDTELFAWADGRLVLTLRGCELVDPNIFFEHSTTDSIFFSFSADRFENFRCELVVFGEHQVIQEDAALARQVANSFHDFNIILIVLLIILFGLFAGKFQGRLNFFISKTFSLKSSTYQFTNTSFFGRANLLMIVIISCTAAFEIIYIIEKTKTIGSQQITLGTYFVWWLKISGWILLFFLAKRMITQGISRLFQMAKLRDWQLFDLVNFSGYFVLILFFVILWDFILKGNQETWINDIFTYYFIAVLLLFAVWFVIKFVVNSSYRKLLIISYLCATEIIPSILIMVWFLK